MSGTLYSFRTRKPAEPLIFELGGLLWWEPLQKTITGGKMPGYPIQITGISLKTGTFLYVTLSAEPKGESCSMTHPSLRTTSRKEVDNYINAQLERLEPDNNIFGIIGKAFSSLVEKMTKHHEAKRLLHEYRLRMKSYDLL